ncbi:MAG: hypothetical protein FWC59_01320 [Actinomycetia bacterium]|nr:hypothetical protein [Actinomycetes bacterium]
MAPRQPALRPRATIGVGVTTLVTIFLFLLLTTFSVLSLVAANYDRDLSNRVLAASTDYYAADNQACQWLADLQDVLNNQSPENWPNSLAASAPGVRVEATDPAGSLLVSRSFPINGTLQLSVRLQISADGQITILSWRSGSLGGE